VIFPTTLVSFFPRRYARRYAVRRLAYSPGIINIYKPTGANWGKLNTAMVQGIQGDDIEGQVRDMAVGDEKCSDPGLGALMKEGDPTCSYLYSFWHIVVSVVFCHLFVFTFVVPI